jgi:hypothetical protein
MFGYVLTCFISEVILEGEEELLFARVVTAWAIGTRRKRVKGVERGCFFVLLEQERMNTRLGSRKAIRREACLRLCHVFQRIPIPIRWGFGQSRWIGANVLIAGILLR